MCHVLDTESKPACETGKFRCDDGACIDEDYRCDDVSDCQDGSDERYCGGPVNGSGMYRSVLRVAQGCGFMPHFKSWHLIARAFLFKLNGKATRLSSLHRNVQYC